MRTASRCRGVRALAPVVLLGTITGLALQGCVSVGVRVEPSRTAPTEPTVYYGVVEHTDRSPSTEPPTYEEWDDCWST